MISSLNILLRPNFPVQLFHVSIKAISCGMLSFFAIFTMQRVVSLIILLFLRFLLSLNTFLAIPSILVKSVYAGYSVNSESGNTEKAVFYCSGTPKLSGRLCVLFSCRNANDVYRVIEDFVNNNPSPPFFPASCNYRKL